jgi:hypothetical protein
MWDSYIDAMRNPNLNPAYRSIPTSGGWLLEREIDPPYAIERTIQDCVLLPGKWHVNNGSVDRSGLLKMRDVDRVQLRELVRRFLILDLPKCYV